MDKLICPVQNSITKLNYSNLKNLLFCNDKKKFDLKIFKCYIRKYSLSDNVKNRITTKRHETYRKHGKMVQSNSINNITHE